MEESLPLTVYQDLKDQIPMLVEALKTGAEYGGDLAHRFIMYDIWVQVVPMILFFVIVLVAGSLHGKVSKWRKAGIATSSSYDTADYQMAYCAYLLVLLALASVFLAFIAKGSLTIIKDLYIPEVRIVEVLNNLLNSTPQ